MQKYEAVKAWCEQRIGCPYIYGATGQICTPSYRQARMAQYPDYAAKIKKNCPRLSGGATTCETCRWADPNTGKGKEAYDCAQLSRWCMNFVGVTLVSGATSQWQQTAWAQKGEIANMPLNKVCLVFRNDGTNGAIKMGHVGIYQGDGTVIHAKGHDYGVVQDSIDSVKFTHFGIPTGLYEGAYERPALRRGDTGSYVKVLQEYMVARGYTLKPTKSAANGCDGIFGADTEATLKKFQARKGLPATGVCDSATWNALEAPEAVPDEDAESPSDRVPDGYVLISLAKLKEMEAAANLILADIKHAQGDDTVG